MTVPNTPELFAAALSSITKTRIISFQEYLARTTEHAARVARGAKDEPPLDITPIDLLSLFSTQLISGPVHATFRTPNPPDPGKPACPPGRSIVVTIKTLPGQLLHIACDEPNTVGQVKLGIFNMTGLPVNEQKLVFNGKVLTDALTLADCNIIHQSVVLLARDTPFPHLYVPEEIRDPNFDYDYTFSGDIDITFKNGIYFHRAPCGWRRFALNVTNLYLGQDQGQKAWFGGGRRKGEAMAVGEWPVAYIGTGLDTGHSSQDVLRYCKQEPPKRRRIRITILALWHWWRNGVRPGKIPTTWFSHGVYTTPDIDVAEIYATKFYLDGVKYKAVLQVRVNPNPKRLKTLPTFGEETVEYWVSQDESDVRPWGILIKKI